MSEPITREEYDATLLRIDKTLDNLFGKLDDFIGKHGDKHEKIAAEIGNEKGKIWGISVVISSAIALFGLFLNYILRR